MDINDLKCINDKVNLIVNMDRIIVEKINNIDNDIVKGVFNNIYSDVVNNIEIDKNSLLSIYDYSENENSKEIIFDNIKLIDKLNLIHFINFNDYDSSFYRITDELNTIVVNKLNITNSIDLRLYFDYDLEMFLSLIIDNIVTDDVFNYFDDVYRFYMSFNNVIDKFNKDYGEFY